MNKAIVVIALLAVVLLVSGCCSMNRGGSGCASCDQTTSTGAVDGDKVAGKGCYAAKTGGPACPQ